MIEKTSKKKSKHTGCVIRKAGYKQIGQRIKRENNWRIYPPKQSLEERSLQFLNWTFGSLKNLSIPLTPNTPHQTVRDHVPDHPISMFTKLACFQFYWLTLYLKTVSRVVFFLTCYIEVYTDEMCCDSATHFFSLYALLLSST